MRKIPLAAGVLAAFMALTFGGVNAYFTDKEDVRTDLFVGSSGILLEEPGFKGADALKMLPGKSAVKDPVVKNVGGVDIYLFMQVDVPVLGSEDDYGEVFKWDESGDWELVNSKFLEGKIRKNYVYGSVDNPMKLGSGERSTPIFSGVSVDRAVGISALSGGKVSLDVRAFGIKAETAQKAGNQMDGNMLLKLLEDNPPDRLDSEKLENSFSFAKISAELVEEVPDETDTFSKSMAIKNSGDVPVYAFFSVKNQKDFFVLEKSGVSVADTKDSPWIPVDSGEEGRVIYGYKRPLSPQESTERLFDRLYLNPGVSADAAMGDMALGIEGICIQSFGVLPEGETGEELSPEDLKEIYALCDDKSGFMQSKILKDDLFSTGNAGVEIVEDFPAPAPLHMGENVFKKVVSVKNTGNMPVYPRVKVEFSDDFVKSKSSISGDGGKTYISVAEFMKNPSSEWTYVAEGPLGGYFYYKKPLGAGAETTTIFTNIKTIFNNVDEIRDFDVNVYAEVIEEKRGVTGFENQWKDALDR